MLILFYNIDNKDYYNIPLAILNFDSQIKHYELLHYNNVTSISKNSINSKTIKVENNFSKNKEINEYIYNEKDGNIKNKETNDIENDINIIIEIIKNIILKHKPKV